jgi:AsmA family protein
MGIWSAADQAQVHMNAPCTSSETPTSSRRTWRIAVLVLGIVAGLITAGYLALRHAFPPERVAALLSEQVTAATGREFHIHGQLSIKILRNVIVEARDVTLGNVEWGSQPEMMRIGRAAFEISMRDLLARRIRVVEVELQGAQALLETDAEGRFNWQLAPKPQSTRSTTSKQPDRIVVTDALITFKHAAKETARTVAIDRLEISAQGQQDRLTAAFRLGQQQWKLEGETGRASAVLRGLEPWRFDLRAATEGATVSAKGEADVRGRNFEIQLSGQIETALVLAPLDLQWVPMPLHVRTMLRRSAGQLSAESLQASIAGQLITGRVALDLGPAPRVDADLAATVIDLAKWGIAKGSAGASAGAVKPRTTAFVDRPLPFGAWPAFGLRIALRIKELALPAAPTLSAVQVVAVSERGRLTVEPFAFHVGGGQVRGRLKIALGQRSAPRTELSIDATQVSVDALDPLWAGGMHLKGGRANLRANLVMVGWTPRSLAAASTGSVLLTARGVTMAGKGAALDRNVVTQLLSVLAPKQSASEDLVVQCAVVQLPLRNGVAVIDRSIAMETRQVVISANGELNLAKQTVLLAFRPKARKGLDIKRSSLVQLVLLQGPLDNPQLSLDPTGTARLAGNVGVAVATGGVSLLVPALRKKHDETQGCGA